MSMHDGALEACHLLYAAGYELVCVTQLRQCFIEHRLENFRLHGFPIDRIISTRCDKEDPSNNPKKEAIEQLHPIIFVDDKKRNFKDIKGVRTKFVFIDHELDGDPHRDEDIHYDAKYPNLLAFVKDFLKDEVNWAERPID
jgi:phosphoglycolate phosphatase-like HAD superfamily hydrolase